MPVKSKAQGRLMQAVANNPAFAKKVGISKKVADKFVGPQAHKEADVKKPAMNKSATKTAQKPKKFLAGGITGKPVYTPPPASPSAITARDILEMAVGKRGKDMQYDMNNDGRITSADALAYARKNPTLMGAAPAVTQASVPTMSTPGARRGVATLVQPATSSVRQPAPITTSKAVNTTMTATPTSSRMGTRTGLRPTTTMTQPSRTTSQPTSNFYASQSPGYFGGQFDGFKKGGEVKSKDIDGCAKKGKTKGRYI